MHAPQEHVLRSQRPPPHNVSHSFVVFASLILENWYLRVTLSFIPFIYSKIEDHFCMFKSHVCIFTVSCLLTERITFWCLVELLVTLGDSAEIVSSRESGDSRPA